MTMLQHSATEALLDCKYSLLLGAGASIGGRSENGTPLPKGDEFTIELIKRFNLDVDPSSPLSYVWQAAADEAGSEKALREMIASPRFLRCIPADHHLRIPTFPWKRIFTFNIDDLISQAYTISRDRLQKASPIHFDDIYEDSDISCDTCQIVHLHGAELFQDKPIVFSPRAYASAAIKSHPWWNVFVDLFYSDPFIVAGATLMEPDFEFYGERRMLSRRPGTAPSYYVNAKINSIAASQCQKYGLIPIEMKFEDFISQLHSETPDRTKISSRLARGINKVGIFKSIDSPLSLAIARNFIPIEEKDSWPKSEEDSISFYKGRSPEWEDINSNLDIPTSTINQIVEKVNAVIDSATPAPSLILIDGTVGEGKTVAIMRSAEILSKLTNNVLFFVGSNRFEHEHVLSLISKFPPTETIIIFVDNADEHMTQFQKMLPHCTSNKAKVILICAVRSARKSKFERLIRPAVNILSIQASPINKTEGINLSQRLRSSALLGELAGRTDEDIANIFTSHKSNGHAGNIYSILSDIVPGNKLHERLKDEYSKFDDDTLREFFSTIALASAIGKPLKCSIALRATRINDAAPIFASIGAGSLCGLIKWQNIEYLTTKHRIIAENIIEKILTPEALFDCTLNLLLALEPYVNRTTIKQRTPEVYISGGLMDADGAIIRKLGKSAERLFDNLADSYGWNSRYWEQRALLAKDLGNIQRAHDFSLQAVGIEEHPFPLTTCAKMKLIYAEHDKHLTRETRTQLIDEACDFLDRAIRLAIRWSLIEIHPYHVLFNIATKTSKNILAEIRPKLKTTLNEHAGDAIRRFPREKHLLHSIETLRSSGIIY